MSHVIAFTSGLVLGLVAGLLAYRKNYKRFRKLEEDFDALKRTEGL